MNNPVSRRLKIFTFDPSLGMKIETNAINQVVAHISWEKDLKEGPIGEYLEVIDYDPASGCFYKPVDLNNPELLGTDGLDPSESNPQFHQQMVYAVAMTTIQHFEAALGRRAFWADHKFIYRGKYRNQFVRRLRIYPHALRDRNAYYSPSLKALLFGYFPVTIIDEHNTPGTIVHTCLSHDIVAHEVTHALLDGVHPRFNEPTNLDVHAFHEAFADIVALFQHFSYQIVLENEIKKTRGNLDTENLLSQLAQQFGQATGRGNALRDALGYKDDETQQWTPREPNPHALSEEIEPHARGAILVAAVFKAFLLIYRDETADLFRIATNGTGVLPEGDIHPDLTRRLAYEAAKCATRVLRMCIRAIDYCPPVDITFGTFLRAIITADIEYAPEDSRGYRIAVIQSFRAWGIFPSGITSMGIDALVWPTGDDALAELNINPGKDDIKGMKTYMKNLLVGAKEWNLENDRYEVWKALDPFKESIWHWLRDGDFYGYAYSKIFGLVIDNDEAPPTVFRKENRPTVEVHSVRPTIRKTLQGEYRTDLVVEITQRRRGYFDKTIQEEMDKPQNTTFKPYDFTFRAGCTILIDPSSQVIRRVITTRGTIADEDQLIRVRNYLNGVSGATGNAFDAGLATSRTMKGRQRDEPFALLHNDQNY